MRKYLFILLLFAGCRQQVNTISANVQSDTTIFAQFQETVTPVMERDGRLGEEIVAYAKTQVGVPYRYCSMTPAGGFDCSGFVNYVFNHFNIAVPRASVDFTNVGQEVQRRWAQPGDVILFTGTNSRIRIVGHIGIVIANNGGAIRFIQSTSGIAYGVVESKLDGYYMTRFVKVIRLTK